jgi:hypothetical protein
MDQIEFRTTTSRVEDYKVVDIWINGQSLIDWLRMVEIPYAAAEGQPSLAGMYEGLPPLLVLPPSRHFWGRAQSAYRCGEDGRVSLLEYGLSGVPGEWTLSVRIAVDGQQVSWSGFRQEQRPAWSYEALEAFCFDLSAYRNALQKAKAEAY